MRSTADGAVHVSECAFGSCENRVNLHVSRSLPRYCTLSRPGFLHPSSSSPAKTYPPPPQITRLLLPRNPNTPPPPLTPGLMPPKHLRDHPDDDDVLEDKRPRIASQSSLLEAEKESPAHAMWLALEPMLRRVISEEVERVLAKYLHTKIGPWLSPRRLQSSESAVLRLQFRNRIALPLYTGCKLEGENGNMIQVFLQDAITGDIVIVDNESEVRLDIVVLEGDFSIDDMEDWTFEEFENHAVKEREGKRPLLTGDRSMQLKQGIGTLGELVFTDNSSWIRSRKFRLGVKASTGCINGSRVREAKTEPFFVKDHRGQLYKKHYPPKLSDDVWRLEKIGKDGAYHKRLSDYKVYTVKDFLKRYATAPTKLREIFGTTMSMRTWDSIIEHAKTCILNGSQHVFYPDHSHSIGVVLNAIYQPLGIIRDEVYFPSSSLSDTEQVYMDRLVQEAHNDLDSILELPEYVKYSDMTTNAEREQTYSSGTLLQSDFPGQQFHREDVFQEDYVAAISTEGSSNMISNDASVAATEVRMVYRNDYSPGTLETLISHESYFARDAEGFQREMPNQSAYVNKEVRVLTTLENVNGESFSGCVTECDVLSSITNPLESSCNSLHRKPYIGWIKLKAIFKICYLIKNKVGISG